MRFGAQTDYCLLDIDIGSAYHPQRDALAIARMAAALEPIGLVTYVCCTSSYSGGLHLYFPFSKNQSSWELATVVGTLLENAGFLLKPGQLEIFPNPKPYIVEGSPSLFNAHRLPLQAGSYLLNQDFQPIWTDHQTFVQSWGFAQQNNAVDSKTLKQILKQAKRKHYRISGKADKFINDLNAEIEPGWTGSGQTNYLLGRIAMRAYVFHHVITGGVPLEGSALVDEIISTAESLPGYREWCNHQHEIGDRATEWARCVESSHYFHYGDAKGKYKAQTETALIPALDGLPTWNQQQSEAARERIRKAIADMLETDSLPSGATKRFQALTRCGISGRSLYRHRDLWHPNYLGTDLSHPLGFTSLTDALLDCAAGASNSDSPTSLLDTVGGNARADQELSDHLLQMAQLQGDNSHFSPSCGDFSAASASNSARSDCGKPELPQQPSAQATPDIQPIPFTAQSWLEVSQEASRVAHEAVDRIRQEADQTAQITRMQRYLASGDAILMAEAMAWAEVNPGVLNVEAVRLCAAIRLGDGAFQSAPSALDARQSEEWQLQTLDLSDVLVAISIHLRRLQWTADQTSTDLLGRFGKPIRSMLSELELLQWLECLEAAGGEGM
ncbi:MAG TPA: hypothetical protein V6C57_05975 [Coleofasciculaceae cyanobacterium]